MRIAIILFSSCQFYNQKNNLVKSEKVNIIEYELPDVINNISDYCLNRNGDFLFLIQERNLISLNFKSNEIKKIEFNFDDDYVFDLVIGNEYIGILYFKIDNNVKKQDFNFIEFDNLLNQVNNYQFESYFKLIPSRFNYVSYYKDGDIFNFNDNVSYVTSVDNLKWDAGSFVKGFIDIENGYKLSINKDSDENFYFSLNEKKNWNIDIGIKPKHFSVLNQKVYVISNQNSIIGFDYLNNKINEYDLNTNPTLLYKNGFYTIKGDKLVMFNLESN